MDKKQAGRHVARVAERVPDGDRARFAEAAESELLALHEGNFARYQVTPSQFAAWQEVWNTKTVVRAKKKVRRGRLPATRGRAVVEATSRSPSRPFGFHPCRT